MPRLIPRLLPFALIALTLLAACGSATPTPLPTAVPTGETTAVPVPTAAPTATAAPQSLVVCQAEEPRSLYLYAGLTSAAWNVLEAVYDGPVDRTGYTPQAVILESVPALANGGATLAAVDVQGGDEVVNSHGEVVTLEQGVQVRPSGCDSTTCAIAWDGQSPLQMDQVTASFKLRPGLLWSDGTPLTAADSVFSFDIAADPATPTFKAQVDRTAAYRQTDELTVQWSGKPGLVEADAGDYYFIPLPRHLLGSVSAADLLQSADAATRPLGWGAFTVEEWVAGDHITLRKNPNYFRAAEGLPRFDSLVFRFIPARQELISALQAGECDLIDRTAHLEDDLPALSALEAGGKAQILSAAGPEWEQLVFGIQPAGYDDGYNPAVDRVDFFGDARVRQAFATCIDRQAFITALQPVVTSVPASYLPGGHPQVDSAVATYAYDPAAGGKLLDEAGWKDSDGDPATPRVAQGVQGVPDGTPLSLNLLTPDSSLRRLARASMIQSLAQCGIQVQDGQPAAMSELFAEGPAGVVFGRNFDLVQLSWATGTQPQCFLYESWRVPNAANQWIGTNVAGYASAEYDAACERALDGRAGDDAWGQAQTLFAQQLPAIPLYLLPKVVAARADVCGVVMDGSARSDLWSLEQAGFGAACAP